MKPHSAVRAGPVTGIIAQVALIAALAGIVGLGGVKLGTAGWVVGLSCGVITNAALARGIASYGCDRLSPADWVTLARATLAVGIAALTAASFEQPVPAAMVVSLAATALALDAVDGWVARRTRTTNRLGARFDGEVDAFLIMVLSVYLARSAGAWVLAIGAARYAFLAAGWALPWLREPLPPRYWRKVVAATQGIVLTVAAADVLPPTVSEAALVVALVLLAGSFGRDVWWLRSHRGATQARAGAGGDHAPSAAPTSPGPGRQRVRTWVAAALTTMALLLVWGALVAPAHPVQLTLAAFVRLPLEGLVLVAAVVLLPARARLTLAAVAGAILALVAILKLLDIGFFATFNRPFDPYQDLGYAGIAGETLPRLIGVPSASMVIAGTVLLVAAVFALMTLAVLRLTRLAAGHRRTSLQAVGALGFVWMLCWVFGASLVSDTRVASTSAAGVLVDKVGALRAGIADRSVFAGEIADDPLREVSADRLLRGLRGKDVILAFVESYGEVAVRDPEISPGVGAVLDTGTERLRAAGFSSRSAFLTSPVFGGISWQAHATLHAGLRVDTSRRYDQLLESNRFTLSGAFKRAGWRTVAVVPSNDRDWSEGESFYRFDRIYDQRNLGYRGPSFAYASMPDQYSLSALQRLELAKHRRRPLFAEVDLVSSHTPWTHIPPLIDWSRVGDGSVFNRMPTDETSKDALWSDSALVSAAYGRSIEYALNALISFVLRHGDRDLVLIVVGDHQPWTMISGLGASHDVPISLISHDPAVLDRIGGWDWSEGLRTRPEAPVWPMSAFRDRFLGAFGGTPP